MTLMNPDLNSTPPPPEAVREDWVYTQRLDAKGQPFDELEQCRSVFLSPEGAVVQKQWRKERHYHCGHGAEQPMGGKCSEPGCFNVSCASCFTRCSKCQIGLCLYHVRYIDTDTGQKQPICAQCREGLQRQRFWRRFWTNLLSPWVEFDRDTR